MKGALRHLGEVKITIKDDKNLDSQFKAFANLEMNGKEIPFILLFQNLLKKE